MSFKPLPEFNHQISLVVISISALGFTISGITKNIIIGIILLVLGIVVLILARYPSNPQYEII
jgi:membrane-bound ClpP family serine protease